MSAFHRVLDDVGSAIVAGTLPAGNVDSTDGLVERTGASRSIVREAVRVLVALGMLSSGPRVGLRVLPAERWDVIDPLVIRWRLDGPDRPAALADLRELRRAIEPAAAAAAARVIGGSDGRRRPAPTCAPPPGVAVLAAADRLRRAADAHDGDAFLAADRDLHGAVLSLSGNAMFARLQRVVEQALEERAGIGPDEHDVDLHGVLARAIAAGDADGAAAAMREVVDRT
ncbi:FadR/GntR family transcriptional regulator [Curtobacterium sp. RRHDQ10]|uniref:FadR/GntR family transcriptional regulator n=1 Tax=Curtobacterium phyllosphaerae TaxID=3413379 RepID=UPI003BEF854A